MAKIIREINVKEQKEKDRKKEARQLGKFKEINSKRFKEIKKEESGWEDEEEEDDSMDSGSFVPDFSGVRGGGGGARVLSSGQNSQKESLEQNVANSPEAATAGKPAQVNSEGNISYNAPEYSNNSYRPQESKWTEKRLEGTEDVISNMQRNAANVVGSNLQMARGIGQRNLPQSAWNEPNMQEQHYQGSGELVKESKGIMPTRKIRKI